MRDAKWMLWYIGPDVNRWMVLDPVVGLGLGHCFGTYALALTWLRERLKGCVPPKEEIRRKAALCS